jgi:serine/threonine protein kinase, bacterial
MSYCINPNCPHPQNPNSAQQCRACGSVLVLRDRYRVMKALGKGGFGATFLARNVVLPGNPICVIKQLRVPSTDAEVLKRARTLFRREAATLGKIGNHPQLPSLLDYFEIDNQFYLVQEYVQGWTLKQEVQQEGHFNEAKVKAVLDEVLLLLKYLQQQEVIHRDIKPANIIRREIDNRLVLIDFGAVKDEVSQTQMLLDGGTQLPNTCFAIGTPGFAPREQIAMQPVYASDIYALAATCLYLLTGESPRRFTCNPMTGEILWRERVQVSDRLANILDKMLKPLVYYRYQSAEEALADLHRDPSEESSGRVEFLATDETISDFPMVEIEESENWVDSLEPVIASPPAYTPPPPIRFESVKPESGRPEPIKPEPIKPEPAKSDLTRSEPAKPDPLPSADFTSNRTDRARPLNPELYSDSATPSRSLSWKSRQNSTTDFAYANSSEGQSQLSGRLSAKAFKAAYDGGLRNFADCDLSGLDLQHADLSQVNFYGSKFVRANLKSANLYRADLSLAGLNDAILRGANLSYAYLTYANLSGADLRGADLSNASLNHASLRGANLCGANLSNAKVTASQLATAKTNWRTIMPNGKRTLFS